MEWHANSNRCRHMSIMWMLPLVVVVLWAVLPAGAHAQSDAPTSEVAEDASTDAQLLTEIDQRVMQLGDASYVARERASRRLRAIGSSAREQLLEAIGAKDEEIRFRARRLLLAILEEGLSTRIDQFSINSSGSSDTDLPGWHDYREIAGDTPDSRRFFVEIIRSEPLLLESLEAGAREGADALRVRCAALQRELQQPTFNHRAQTNRRVSIGTVGALFLLAVDDDATLDENISRNVQMVLYQSSFQTDINTGPRSEPLRRLLGRWIVRNRSTNMAYQGLHFSMQYNLPEGAELARHLIEKGGHPANLLQTALLVLGRFGEKQDVALLKPLLQDSTPIHFGAAFEGTQQEVRDIALAVSIHLSGQQPADFGFPNAQGNPQMLFNPGTLRFSNPAMRDAAFKKWDAWQARVEKQPVSTPKNG